MFFMLGDPTLQKINKETDSILHRWTKYEIFILKEKGITYL